MPTETCASVPRYLLTRDQVSLLLCLLLLLQEPHPLTGIPGIDELRVQAPAPAPHALRRSPPRHGKGELFLKGPIPWRWLSAAGASKGRALQVALVLWLEAAMKRAVTVKLTHARLREMGVDRSAARRGLSQLERAGLVAVLRRNGAAPWVTLKAVGEPTQTDDRDQGMERG